MVDRGRSPIRPTPFPSAPTEEGTDPLDVHRKATVESVRSGAAYVPGLFARDDRDLDEPTAQISAEDLDDLLKQARPGSVPSPRRTLTTQPYDAVTANALLDQDAASPVPAGARDDAPDDDAPDIEAIDDDESELELSDADVEPQASPSWLTTGPILATPVANVPVAESSAPASQSIPPAAPSASPPASTPQSSAIPPSAARASLPSAGMEWPGAQDRQRRTRMAVGAVGALAAIGILYLALTEPEPAPIAPTPAVVVEPPPPLPAPIVPKPQSLAEIDARKALSRLREGMGDCVRKAIGSLPGSSPAVPSALKQTSGVGYTALPADWKTAVWSCSKFRHDAPMQFQLQWQSVKPGAEAVGLAWVDDDGDGEPDRAFGFRATAKGTRDVDLGEIGPMEMRPVLPVR